MSEARLSPGGGLRDAEPLERFLASWAPSRLLALAYLVVALVSGLLYAQTVRFGFVWDDAVFVEQNPAIRSWSYAPKYFTDGSTYAIGHFAGMYRPLRNVSYLIDFKIAGLAPAWFHAHNVLLHIVCGCLALFVLLRLGELFSPEVPFQQRVVGSFLAALVWVVHPVLTEAVSWVKGRDEMLFSAFYLSAVAVLLRGLHLRVFTRSRAAVVAGLYAGSLLSKEMALSFPIVATLIWLLSGRRIPSRKLLAPALLLVGLSGALIVARHAALGRTSQTEYLSGSFYREMLTMTCAGAHYLRLAIFPGTLLADYEAFPVARSLHESRVILSLLAIVWSLAVAGITMRRCPMVALGVLWFWATLLPVSNVVPTMQFLAERFLYLPTIGLSIVIMALLLQAGRLRVRTRVLAWSAVGLLIVIFGIAAVSRIPVWRDNYSLFSRTYQDGPKYGRAAYGYAQGLVERRAYEQAAQILQELADAKGTRPPHLSMHRVHDGLGSVLMTLGRWDEGIAHTRRAAQLAPEDPLILRNLGRYEAHRGNDGQAITYFDRALRGAPLDFDARIQRAWSLARLGRYSEAVAAHEELARLFPQHRPLIARSLADLQSRYGLVGGTPDHSSGGVETTTSSLSAVPRPRG